MTSWEARARPPAPSELVERRLPSERRRPAAHRGLALQRELITALRTLAAGGISEVVVLKGVPLALQVFGSVAEREMGDIDLLVPRRDAPRALSVLATLGYEPYLGQPPDFDRQHAVKLERSSSWGRVHVDLHWTAFHAGFEVDEEVQWRHTQRFAHQGLDCAVFDPPMTILHLAQHYVVHLSPKVLRDFASAWNIWGENLDQSDLLSLARSTGLLDALAVAFGQARESDLLDAAAPHIRSGRGAVVLRLVRGRLGRSDHGRLIIGLLAMRHLDGVRSTLHLLFPRRSSMRVIYGDGTPAQVAWRYLARPFEFATKAARTLKTQRSEGQAD